MPDLPREDPTQVLYGVQRETLERLTGERWLLNPDIPPGTVWSHSPGPSDPAIGPDTSIPTHFINPADLTTCLAAVVGVPVPAADAGQA